MIIVKSKAPHIFSAIKKDKNGVAFLLPNRYISKNFIRYFNKFGLIDMNNDFIEESLNVAKPFKLLAEKYFEEPLELLFTCNVYKNTDKLVESAFESYEKGENIYTDYQSAAFLINEFKLRKKTIPSIQLDKVFMRISKLAHNFSKINNTKVSPFVIERFLKLFSFFHNSTMSDEQIETISNFQHFLLNLNDSKDLKSSKELEKYIDDNLTVTEKELIEIIYEQKEISDENAEKEGINLNSINIYFKLIEQIKLFFKAIKDENEVYITTCDKLIILPVGLRKKAEYYFSNILKDVIPNYKQIDEEQTIKEEQEKLDEIEEDDFSEEKTNININFEETEIMTKKLNICMIIDADNASVNALQGVFNELSKHGNIIIRKAYGNWSRMTTQKWENTFRELAIQPVHQIDYTKTKNSTDIAMCIDAMDMMYTNKEIINAFALVTSDSDFTPLAIRLVQQGLTVFGFGEDKTPAPFVNSCSQFIYTESLQEEIAKDYSLDKLYRNDELLNIINKTIKSQQDDDGWAKIAAVGAHLGSRTSLSPVSYGFKSYGHLLKSLTNIYDYKKLKDGHYAMKNKYSNQA